MKKIMIFLVAVLLTGFLQSCEKDDDPVPVPIAPVLKNVLFPNSNDVMPGRPATIRGKGFDPSDKVFIEDDNGITPVELISVSDENMVIMVPKEAGGTYVVTIERAGKQTTLDGELVVPFVIVLEDVVLPSTSFPHGATVNIAGKGFEAGDKIQLTAGFYPDGKVIEVSANADAAGLSFTVPSNAYGINNLIVTRGAVRKTILGTLGIQANPGDEVGGGVVYYTDNSKLHGFIANKTNTGSPTEPFGPAVAQNLAGGTSKDLGAGKTNTSKLVTKMVGWRGSFANWANKKAAFELCDELSVTVDGDTYTDWFLPSQQELVELFKAQSVLAAHGASLPPNNYWSSTEGDGNTVGWSAFYVNFYETVNLVSWSVDKEGWLIGVRAVRSF